MAKPEWGAKRLCPSCGVRFYDLLRDPVDCPSCGTTYALEALSERKSSAPSRAKPKPAKAAPVAAETEREPLVDDDSDEEESIADDDVLLDDEEEEDSDDLGEIGGVAAEDKEEDT